MPVMDLSTILEIYGVIGGFTPRVLIEGYSYLLNDLTQQPKKHPYLVIKQN